MTWAATYTNVTYVAATDWLAGETNAGGGFAVQISAFVHKRSDGLFYVGAAFASDLITAGEVHSSAKALTTRGQWGGATGVGPTSLVDVAGGVGRFGTYDTASSWQPTKILGSTVTINTGTVDIAVASSTGFRPAADNTLTLGSASFRWSTVYAGTGTINTSDERSKEQIDAVPDEWLDAWGDVQWRRFKFREAVAEKGDAARWHLGAVAQAVGAAFSARGLNAAEIGLLCFDEWAAEPGSEPVYDDGGNLMDAGRAPREAGDRWGLRYDECFAMEAAYQRREMGRLGERLAALEGGS